MELKKYRRVEKVSEDNKWNTLIMTAMVSNGPNTMVSIEDIHLSHDPIDDIWIFRKRKKKNTKEEQYLLRVISLKEIPEKYLKYYNILMTEHTKIDWPFPSTIKIK